MNLFNQITSHSSDVAHKVTNKTDSGHIVGSFEKNKAVLHDLQSKINKQMIRNK